MHGGTYICNKNPAHRLGHFSNEETGRIACNSCDGWMQLEEQPEPKPHKKPNIIWVGVAMVIWFFLKPVETWLDKHTKDDDDE